MVVIVTDDAVPPDVAVVDTDTDVLVGALVVSTYCGMKGSLARKVESCSDCGNVASEEIVGLPPGDAAVGAELNVVRVVGSLPPKHPPTLAASPATSSTTTSRLVAVLLTKLVSPTMFIRQVPSPTSN